ncbi:MAG: hypothetical protein AB7F91_04620 [Parvularculaceae bacterium]
MSPNLNTYENWKSALYKEIRRFNRADGTMRIVIEKNEIDLFRYVTWKLIKGDEYSGEYWSAIAWSGYFESAEDAQRDLLAATDWVVQGYSN